jgi:fructosamine-3-kinase
MPTKAVDSLEKLVRTHLGGEVVGIADQTLGFSGSLLYAVDVAGGDEQFRCIAKFTPAEHDADDSVTNRVYGSRISNFDAAYACLQQHHVPLPKLYASIPPQPELPYFCQLMESLPGEEVRSALKTTPPAKQAALQACLGRQMGVIHQITRAYDGWIELSAPDPLIWRDAFFLALDETIEASRDHALLAPRQAAVAQTITRLKSKWSDPPAFVLAHGDGIQGTVIETSQGWQVTGVFDIEDYYFSDQRFVFSVLELGFEIDGIALLPSFWAAYESEKAIDPTYQQVRPLFQLYVLLDWIKNMEPGDDLPQQLARKADRLTDTQ